MIGPNRLRRLIARGGGLLAATSLVGLGALGPVGSGIGPTTATAASPTAQPDTVQVTAVLPQILRPGADLTVTATVRNDSTTALVAPRATVRINRFRMAASSELSDWTGLSATDRTAGTAVRSVDLPGPLAPGASADVTITVPASAIGLNSTPDAWGPRGLAVELTDGTQRIGVQRTFLLWLPDVTARQVRVSAFVPIVGPALDLAPDASTGTPTAPAPSASPTASASPAANASPTQGTGATSLEDTRLDALMSTGGRLRAVLDATRGHPDVSWALDPALVERAAVSGVATTEWLTDLTREASGRDVLALPWGDPDLGAIAHSTGTSLLDVAEGAASASTAPVFGSKPRTDVLWPAEAIPDKVTAALAARSGARGLVVGPTALAPEKPVKFTPSGITRVTTADGSVSALVPDPALSALLTDATSVDPGTTPATAALRMLAETAVVAHETTSGSPNLLATVPRDWAPDASVVQSELDALTTAPWVDLTPISALLGASDDGIDRSQLPASVRDEQALSPARVEALAESRSDVASFATVVAEPDVLLAGLDRDVLAPLAVTWRADSIGRNQLVDAVLGEATQRRSGLTVLVNPKFSVIASTTQIRLTVHSDLRQTATVWVKLLPSKACMSVPSAPTPATVAAGSDAVVAVDVRANANCDVKVEVHLVSADGTVVAAPAQFSARLAPTIENVGTAVVGVLLALGLVAGIVRTVRRGQSGARMATGEMPQVAPLGPEPQHGTANKE